MHQAGLSMALGAFIMGMLLSGSPYRHAARGQACSMCGEFCAMELAEKYLGVPTVRC